MHLFIAFQKMVEALSKEKDCEIVGEWVKSMVNCLYWCAVSTSNGNGDEIKRKWISLRNHIQNIHSGQCNEFPRCEYPPLRGRGKKKKLIKPT